MIVNVIKQNVATNSRSVVGLVLSGPSPELDTVVECIRTNKSESNKSRKVFNSIQSRSIQYGLFTA